jgi:hypothetical protein
MKTNRSDHVIFTKEFTKQECARRGVKIKWFGWSKPVGFTSSFEHWQYIQQVPELARTKKFLILCAILESL